MTTHLISVLSVMVKVKVMQSKVVCSKLESVFLFFYWRIEYGSENTTMLNILL